MPSFARISAALMPSHVEAILDQDPLVFDPDLVVLRDQVATFLDRLLRVVRQPRIDFRRDAARHDLEDAQPELDRELIECERDDFFLIRPSPRPRPT